MSRWVLCLARRLFSFTVSPTVFTHGSYSGPLLRKAHPEWRILAVDLRGHGASSMPPATECAATPERCFRVTDHATDIVAFMRGMGIQRASLVGHSLGSLITQEIALSNPGMVERAVLIGTGATVVGNPVIHDFLERDTIEATWKPEIEAKGKRFPQDLYDLPLREVSPKMEEWLVTTWGADPVENPTWLAAYVRNTLGMPAGTWVGGARAVQQFDNTKRLGDLKVPTLVVWGTQDSIFLSDPDQAAVKTGAGQRVQGQPHGQLLETIRQLTAARLGRSGKRHRPCLGRGRAGHACRRHWCFSGDRRADDGLGAQR